MQPPETIQLVEWMMDNNIPSIGPSTAMVILRIHQAIIHHKGPIPPYAKEFAGMIIDFCTIEALHQGKVIHKLEELVDNARKE